MHYFTKYYWNLKKPQDRNKSMSNIEHEFDTSIPVANGTKSATSGGKN